MRNQWIGVGAFLVFAAGASVAPAAVFYGIKNNGMLTRIDTSAQTVTTLAALHAGPTFPTGFQDLEFDGSGNLYAVRAYTDFNTFQSFNEIYRVTNPALGNALLSGTMAIGGNPFHSLAYNPSDSTFYSVNAINGHVVTMNTNGAFSSVSGVGNGPRNLVPAMAINPVNGDAYGLIDMGIAISGTVDYTLIRMNLVTGVSTLVGSLGVTTDSFPSLRFDETGVAYTISNFGGNVYTINLNTGAASFLFAGGAAATQTTGMALVIPAPAGVGLLLAGSGLAVRRRRR